MKLNLSACSSSPPLCLSKLPLHSNGHSDGDTTRQLGVVENYDHIIDLHNFTVRDKAALFGDLIVGRTNYCWQNVYGKHYIKL
jgi:hypothetical protein